MKSGKVVKIVIELDVAKLGAGKASVKGILDDGTTVPFSSVKSLQKAPKMRDVEHPPKFQDATSITVVRTNPCGWVNIGGVWYYRCW